MYLSNDLSPLMSLLGEGVVEEFTEVGDEIIDRYAVGIKVFYSEQDDWIIGPGEATKQERLVLVQFSD